MANLIELNLIKLKIFSKLTYRQNVVSQLALFGDLVFIDQNHHKQILMKKDIFTV